MGRKNKILLSHLTVEGITFEVTTKGNFSSITNLFVCDTHFFRELLYEFERQLGLRIISWQNFNYLSTPTVVDIVINHEPVPPIPDPRPLKKKRERRATQ